MPEDVVPEGVSHTTDPLDKVEARLYAQEPVPVFTAPSLPVTPVAPPPVQASPILPPAWEPPPPPPSKKPFSWTVLFLGIALVFFVGAGGISTFLFLEGGRTVSSNNITISVQGATSISSGSIVPLVVTIKNNNPAAITNTDIELDFPDGTRSADDVTQPLVRYTDTLGSIPAGGTVTRTVQAVLFGSVNQSGTIPVTIHYNTANSNAVFTKEQDYAYNITSSPLTITAQSVSSVASGQSFTIALTVRSNASTPLNDIAIVAQYPVGFSMQKTEIGTTEKMTAVNASSSLLSIGTLAPGDQENINITGSLSGTDNDRKDFQFTVGTAATDGTPTLAVAYASQATAITLAKPFLDATLSLNHSDTDPTVVSAGEAIDGLLTWVNSLATSITNAQISIKFTGAALDQSSMGVANGFYDSSNNTLVFTPQTENSLALLNSGDTGNGTFNFSLKSGSALTTLRNPTIQMAVSVSGQPTGQNAETITNTLTKTIKVATDLELLSQAVHTSGPFVNSGPWPPVPNQPTTYTIELAVTNTVNSVGGATASMILPVYVTYAGKETTSSGAIAYDPTTRTLTWNIGDVGAGTTIAKPVTAAFQVAFLPSDSQSQSEPIIVGSQTITGTDRFTSAQVGNVAPALTTQISSDPAYKLGDGMVGTGSN